MNGALLIFLLLSSLMSSFLVCGLLISSKNFHLRLSGDHDLDGPQKFHQEVTPRIGGVGLVIGFLTASITAWFIIPDVSNALGLSLVAALPLFLAGLAEDFTKRVGVKVRLAAAFISACLFLFMFEISYIYIEILDFDLFMSSAFLATSFLVFSIVGLSNAYNIIDGFHGLASMVGIIGATAVLYVAVRVQDPIITSLTFVTIGSTFGFFLWNYPRGLIFFGDSGAYFTGFLLAITSILLVVRNPSVSPWFALAVNIYPVFETLFSIWRRALRRGRHPARPDCAHLHSLIFRRVVFRTNPYAHSRNNLSNARTSPYLWVVSSIGVTPAVLWWDKTLFLVISIVAFILIYIYAYRVIVTFKLPAIFGIR